MSKDIVDPAVETPPAPPVEDTPPAPPVGEVPPAPPTDDTPPAPPADAGGAAAETPVNDQVPVDGSRTGFVEKGQAGGQCICPDGRKGTIHTFDAGLVCIPNHDQSE